MLARNEALPGGPKLEFRMGLNVADIIPDEDDVFGDGVNVAARLEALAAPSGICISGAVYEQIKHSAGDMFERVGPRALKNIEMPVEVYAVNFGRQREVSQGNCYARMRRARRPFVIAGAIALLVAGAAAVSVIEFSPPNSGDSSTAAAPQQPGAAPGRAAAQAALQTEAERIDAGAETEAAKAKARATIAVAKAEAGAAAAEAQAKAQLVERAVNAWKHASIALTEAAGQVSQAEAQLAELKARLAVLQESEPTALDGAEKTRLLDALKQRIASAQKDLEIIQVRHDAAVKAEKETAAHMGKLKADLSSAGN